MLGLGLTLALGRQSAIGGGGATVLSREPDGTVTIQSLGPVYTATLDREPDGTVTVGAA